MQYSKEKEKEKKTRGKKKSLLYLPSLPDQSFQILTLLDLGIAFLLPSVLAFLIYILCTLSHTTTTTTTRTTTPHVQYLRTYRPAFFFSFLSLTHLTYSTYYATTCPLSPHVPTISFNSPILARTQLISLVPSNHPSSSSLLCFFFRRSRFSAHTINLLMYVRAFQKPQTWGHQGKWV